jgi:exopolysaccharide production protein ExoZ
VHRAFPKRDTTTPRIVSIQILRAVAALSVMFAHLWSFFWTLGLGGAFPNFDFGAAGVDLFFVISGFIMVYVSESLFGRRGSPVKFFVRRVVRIVPLYWILTAVTLIGWHGFRLPPNITWLNVASSFLFIPTTHPNGATEPLLSVGWTLNYEMLFYAVFAAATLLSRSVAVIAVTAFFLLIVTLPWLLSISLTAPFAVWRSPIVFEFVYGMWIALIFRKGLRIPGWISCVLVAAGLALMVGAYVDGFAAFGFGFVTIGRVIGWGGGAAVVVAAMVLADVKPATSPIWMGFVFLGDTSYALYLIHTLIPPFLFRALWFVDPAAHIWLYAAMLTSATVSAAVVVHLVFERPVLAFLHVKIGSLTQRLS